jgi:hypothetical protein
MSSCTKKIDSAIIVTTANASGNASIANSKCSGNEKKVKKLKSIAAKYPTSKVIANRTITADNSGKYRVTLKIFFMTHILNTPNFVSGTGALSAALKAKASTRRVSLGAMMPSSHIRAVA